MCENKNDSIMINPVITGAYNDTGEAPLEVITDLFIPLVTLDTRTKIDGLVYLGSNDEILPLLNFDKTEVDVENIKFTLKTKVKFQIEQGNTNAKKEKDSIMILSNQVNMVNVIHNGITTPCESLSTAFLDDVKYGDTFEIEIEPYELQENSYSDAYILFQYYEASSVADCGKVRFTDTSKVGKRLVTNIEGLPLAPKEQQLPWTREYVFGNANASFNIANQYQNPLGMCFAITMKRIEKAYQDLNINDAIKAISGNNDYTISGTTSTNIEDVYFGYGVGGALAKNGYGELVPNDDVWDGKLEEGAVIQYWTNKKNVSWQKLKQSIKNSLNQTSKDDYFTGGHSVVFKSYTYSKYGNITGIRYYDYHGISRKQIFEKTNNRILLGTNLKDEKK